MAKQLEISEDKIDVEYLILKRRLYENMMYPQKRIQAFSPASGKPSVNKVMNRLQEFMDECYDDKGKIISNDYEKCEKHKSVEVVRIYNDRTKFKNKSNRFLATDFEQEVFQELMKLKQLDYLSGIPFPLYFGMIEKQKW